MTDAPTLPIPAEQLIPHRSPMRLVDALLSCEAGSGTTGACLGADSIVADERGVLDEAALVELIAQSYAAVKGYDDLLNGKPVGKGFLVGIRKLRITGTAHAGDRLLTSVTTVAAIEGFSVIEGTVSRGDDEIASGTMKVWLVDTCGTGR